MAHWWNGYPWRMVQTNLREIDMANMDATAYARELKDFGATVVTLNAAGIIASYETALDYQTKSDYLTGDSLGAMIEECHRNGIRVIARTDFSKVRYPIYEQHPDWAYRDRDGNILNYNGDVQCCPNGAYQQEKMLEILKEVLTRFPFDGVFCNMSGFLVVDYSGVYHGPCHCENCRRRFRAKFGLEIPEKDDPQNPDYLKYSAFKGMVTRAQKQRLVETVRAISPEIAINGVDYIRTESGTELGVPQWQLSASSNCRLTVGSNPSRPADNASVDFLGFRYRETSVSPAQMALRQWQNLANAGSTSLYIMGTLGSHSDRSCLEPSRRAFQFFASHEALYRGLSSAAKVLLVHKGLLARSDPEVDGWIRALTAGHIPFDEVKLAELTPDLLAGKEVVLLPDAKMLRDDQAAMLDGFAQNGGTVVATGETGLYTQTFQPRAQQALQCIGMKAVREKQHDHASAVFYAAGDSRFPSCQAAPQIAFGSDYLLADYEEGTEKLLPMIPEHPFGPPERCYYTEISGEPGVVIHSYGKGKAVYLPWQAGTFYCQEGYQNTLNVMLDVIGSLCAQPSLAPDLHPTVELTWKKQGEDRVLQLVNASGCFANSYFPPLPMNALRFVLPGRFCSAEAYHGGRVTVETAGERTELVLDRLEEYEIIKLEVEK
ncbi:MAG: beta-galactosidase [Clostridiales bacterium]|nr:beta-galactosidase [Clostridiales bacterium]